VHHAVRGHQPLRGLPGRLSGKAQARPLASDLGGVGNVLTLLVVFGLLSGGLALAAQLLAP
jgi:hypothetical protein